jgi:DNA-binding IclR family transcriptional regulator
MVQTIERVTALLDLLGSFSHGISLHEISLTLGLPKGTCHRLLNSLAYFDFVRQDPKTRYYSLGFKHLELASRLLRQIDFRETATPFLKELSNKTKETVHLVILDRDEILYIEKFEPYDGQNGLQMASKIGHRSPAHSCAVGKMLLSEFPRERVEAIIQSKGLPKRTENTITNKKLLFEHLRQIREKGYSIDDEENEVGIRCVAAPIRNAMGEAIAAISISGPAIRITKQAIEETLKVLVMETAREISEKLGYKL